MSANVPKFATFRARPVPDEAKFEESPLSKDEKKQKEHHKRHHGRHRSRSRERFLSHAREPEPPRPTQTHEASDIFVIDKKGDVKNLLYGGNHRYDVPPFHRFGAGHVLGLPSDFKIDRAIGDENGIVIRNLRVSKLKSSREKYVFSRSERERPKLLRIRPQAISRDQVALEANFIPLEAPRGKKRKRGWLDIQDSSSSDSDGEIYRSIYGKGKEDDKLDGDLQYATESDSSGSEAGRSFRIDSDVRQRNIELSRNVERSPADINAWLALIHHQGLLLQQHDTRRVTNAEIRSTADIRIHMYEKALEKTESLVDRERLLQGLMKEGAQIWEIKDQADRWEQISRANIDSQILWTSYLNFKQTNFSTFRYEDVKEVLLKRMKLLLETVIPVRGEANDSLHQQLVYVLLRLTLFMRESGYVELSIATWQSLLEVNLFAPKEPLSDTDAIRRFKDFWDSEVPRIGEVGALGWGHFVENDDNSGVPDVVVDQCEDFLDDGEIFTTWASAERMKSRGLLPARTMDEVVEDDPFRVILFSDVEDFIIRLPSQANLHRHLLNAFLLFCRLPPMNAVNGEASCNVPSHHFIGSNLLDLDSRRIKSEYLATLSERWLDISTEEFIRMLIFSHLPRVFILSQPSSSNKVEWK